MSRGYLTLRFEWFNGRKLFVKFVKFQLARVPFPSTNVGLGRSFCQDFAWFCYNLALASRHSRSINFATS